MSKFDDLQVLKEEIRSRYSIADCLDRYGVHYSRSRRCPCPIHGGDNKTGFSFREDSFCCHTRCGKGDVFTLEQKMSGKDFLTVLYSLCDHLGIPYTRTENGTRESRPQTLATYALTLLPSQVKASEYDRLIVEKEVERDLYLSAQKSIRRRLADPKESGNWARLYSDDLQIDVILDGDSKSAGLDAEIQLLRFRKHEEVGRLRADERKRGLIGKPVGFETKAVAHV